MGKQAFGLVIVMFDVVCARSRPRSDVRCSGWCAYVYDYYFLKDYASPGVGHRYDWEHIIVFVPDPDNPDGVDGKWVCCSQHGDYQCKAESDVRWDGDHPKVGAAKEKYTARTLWLNRKT